jgi:hypothetical protein
MKGNIMNVRNMLHLAELRFNMAFSFRVRAVFVEFGRRLLFSYGASTEITNFVVHGDRLPKLQIYLDVLDYALKMCGFYLAQDDRFARKVRRLFFMPEK